MTNQITLEEALDDCNEIVDIIEAYLIQNA